MSEGVSAYRRAAVETAPPERLISLLLRRAVSELRLAGDDLTAGRHADAFARLDRAQEILTTLRGSLRRDLDTDLPGRLDALYQFAYWRTVEARTRRDPEPCREALAALEPIQDAWDEAFHA